MTLRDRARKKIGPNHWRAKEHSVRLAIKAWTPMLCSLCMSTGLLGVLLNQLPYQFPGLRGIAIAFFILDLLLFGSIASGFLARVIIFPTSTLREFEEEIDSTSYLSCLSIAFSSLVDLTAVICGSNWEGWAVPVTVFWWIDVALAFVAGVLPVWVMVHHEHVDLRRTAPTLLYPAIALTSTAASGAVVAQTSGLSERLALPVIVVSYLLAGMGLFSALLFQAVFLARLIEHSSVEPEKAPTMFVTIGPLATAGYALDVLGYTVGPSRSVFEIAARGPVQAIGDGAYAFGVLFALMLAGFSTLWLLISLGEVISAAGKSTFHLATWSSSYPLAVYALAWNQLSKDFDSPAFRALTTGLTIVVLIHWLYLMIRTIPLVASGSLFLEGVDDDEKPRSEPKPHKVSSREAEEARGN